MSHGFLHKNPYASSCREFARPTGFRIGFLVGRCVEPIRCPDDSSLPGRVEQMTVLAEPELKQKRFLCANCERELFLNAQYCDNCGGKIEWPQKYESILSEKRHDEEKGDDKSPREKKD